MYIYIFDILYNFELYHREEIKMIDETFGEIEYSEDYGYIGRKNIPFGGNENSVEITVMCDDEEEGISPFQRNAYETLMQGWDEIQHRTTGTDPVVFWFFLTRKSYGGIISYTNHTCYTEGMII